MFLLFCLVANLICLGICYKTYKTCCRNRDNYINSTTYPEDFIIEIYEKYCREGKISIWVVGSMTMVLFVANLGSFLFGW